MTCISKLSFAVSWALAITALGAPAPAEANNKDRFVDGKVFYKFSGLDTHFDAPADACIAGVADLAAHGNHKTFDHVTDGSESDRMSCVVQESDGSTTSLGNTVLKMLDCPDTTSPKSTDNSGKFSAMKCHCDDAHGCPAPAKRR